MNRQTGARMLPLSGVAFDAGRCHDRWTFSCWCNAMQIAGHGESSLSGNGLRGDDINRRSESHDSKAADEIPRNGCTNGAVALGVGAGASSVPSAASASSSSIVSTLPHHNAQFLLANPWLHTSLLYSQLYSQRVHPQQPSVVSVIDQDSSDQTDHPVPCGIAHRSPPATPKSNV